MSLDFRRMDAAGKEVLKHTHQSRQIHIEMVSFTSDVHPVNDNGEVTHPGQVDSRWSWTSSVQRLDDMNVNCVEGGGKFPTITLVCCCTDMLGWLNPPVQQSGNSIQTLTPEKNSTDTSTPECGVYLWIEVLFIQSYLHAYRYTFAPLACSA